MISLRPYQTDIVNEARTLMAKGKRRLLIVSPTGSGKTMLTAHMLKTAAERGMASVFIVHRRELIKQSTASFSQVGVRHGIIAGGFPRDNEPHVQIASVQTLVGRIGTIREPKLIIWDECHHLAAGSWTKIFQAYPNAFHIGLTATPERLDGKGLGAYFDDMILGPTVEWLIAEGYLTNYQIFAPPSVNTAGVHTKMGEFVKSEINALYDKPHILGDTAKLYLKHLWGKRAVVFCPSVIWSESLVATFTQANVRAAHVDGETESAERDGLIEGFKNGTVDALSNVGLFSEGFDVPAIDAVIDAAPTLSMASYRQRFGRCLRPFYKKGMPLDTKEQRLAAIAASEKKIAIYLDQSGNVSRHGLPDDVIEWSLDGRTKESRESDSVTIRICPKCFAALRSGTRECSLCKYVFPIESRVIEQVEGELVQVDPEQIRRDRARQQGTAQTETDLIALGRARGYKRPELWARHILMSRKNKR